MVISENIPMTLEVRLNGETLVKGDERSVRVIFNNLGEIEETEKSVR